MTDTISVGVSIGAIAVFTGKISGRVTFTEKFTDNVFTSVIIDVDLHGLRKNARHGFHVHEYGDISSGCDSMCSHFNPYKKSHGSPLSKERHVGDLGNLITDANGCAQYSFEDKVIKLRGSKSNIIGRGLIIHAGEDDCGMGDNAESKITGNAGKRIACSVIGYRKIAVKI